jgi:hypothetical protein
VEGFGVEDFDGDVTLQAQIACAKDNAHAASSDLFDEMEVAENLAGAGEHCSHVGRIV